MREISESSNLPEQHNVHNTPQKSYEGTVQKIRKIHQIEDQEKSQNFYSLQNFLASLNSSIMP